jgi:signal peptidase
MRTLTTIFHSILLVLVVCIVGALLVLHGGFVEGYELLIVRSGSMAPAIDTGSVVLVATRSTYVVGDIVTFGGTRPDSLPTTHRIVGDRVQGGDLVFITKGDANETIDEGVVMPRDIRGAVLFTLPRLGFVLDFARQPLGFLLLIVLPAGLIALDHIATIWNEVRNRRRPEKQQI